MILDLLIALGSVAAFFAGGWLFLSRSLLSGHEERDVGVQVCV